MFTVLCHALWRSRQAYATPQSRVKDGPWYAIHFATHLNRGPVANVSLRPPRSPFPTRSVSAATIAKMISDLLPPGLRMSQDVKDLVMETCTEFVQCVASEANEISTKDNKTTITPEHVVRALEVRASCRARRVPPDTRTRSFDGTPSSPPPSHRPRTTAHRIPPHFKQY